MPRFKCMYALLVLGVALLALAAGCDSGEAPIKVDFKEILPTASPAKPAADKHNPSLRVAVGAMISPRKTFAYYQELLNYLGGKLGRRVELVQKKTYAETNRLLAKGEIHLAFICSGPYATKGRGMGFKLLAAPQVNGSTTYRSYLIVHKDAPYKSLRDLAGATFAFTDPDSNTGWLVPRYWLFEAGETPRRFFGKFLFTHGHDNSILAVAKKLVDAAAVNSLIWDFHRLKHPDLTNRTRIIRKSQPYGIPPVVGSPLLTTGQANVIRQQLLGMHLTDKGKQILSELRIDRFVAAEDFWYDGVRQMQAALHDGWEGE